MGAELLTMRRWIDKLRVTGRLAVARPGVSLAFELAAITKQMQRRSAVLFPSPGGHSVPVVAGLLASQEWVAEILDVPVERVANTYAAAVKAPLPWREVTSSTAQSVVHRAPDLPKILPLPIHNELDSGPYLTAGLLIARNPDTGIQNVSIHRCQLASRNTLSVCILPKHVNAFYEAAQAQGRDLPVSLCIGASPLALLASQADAPIDHDELEIAGALTGHALPVVRCLANEIVVPADSEFILEGRLLPHIRSSEGPFGEFSQYYGEKGERHLIEIDLVSHKPQPIFHTILGGGLEHLLLGGTAREARIIQALRERYSSVTDVALSIGGSCRFHLAVKVNRPQPGEARQILADALRVHPDVKHVVLVDNDVDIRQSEDVEWALATRFQADRDVIVLRDAAMSQFDPSSENGRGTKVGLDATIPPGADPMRFRRIAVPGQSIPDLISKAGFQTEDAPSYEFS